MKKFRKLLLIPIFLLALLITGFLVQKFIFAKKTSALSALRIDSFPKSLVYINNIQKGQTPYYDDKANSGEYTLKLIPAPIEGTYISWEQKIRLYAGSETYVHEDLGPSENKSSEQILWLEKIAAPDIAQLAIVATPDQAKVAVDKLTAGQAPLVVTPVDAGDREVVVSKDGYSDEIIRANAIDGYRLNILVKLAQLDQILGTSTQSAVLPTSALVSTASAVLPPKPYVVIKATETGFLRIRQSPSNLAAEIGRANPEDKFPFVSQEESWVKIKYKNAFGWVASDYVEIVK